MLQSQTDLVHIQPTLAADKSFLNHIPIHVTSHGYHRVTTSTDNRATMLSQLSGHLDEINRHLTAVIDNDILEPFK